MSIKAGDSLKDVLGDGGVGVWHNMKNSPGMSGLNVLAAADLGLANSPVDKSTTSSKFAMAATGVTASVADPNTPQNAPAPQPNPYN